KRWSSSLSGSFSSIHLTALSYNRWASCFSIRCQWDMARLAEFRARMADPDSAVRYWAAMGLVVRGRSAVTSCHAPH
ncbi:MAG: hypothetical protein ACC645_15030, partial [Pirellulales bacterium]